MKLIFETAVVAVFGAIAATVVRLVLFLLGLSDDDE